MRHLMDINELAEYLKLEKQTLYNWLHQHRLPAIKVGRLWRFDREKVDKWLQANSVEPVQWNSQVRNK